jgi:AraC-like DNA-binding protein
MFILNNFTHMSKSVIRIHSISEFHRGAGFPTPEHPLISVVDLDPQKRRTFSGTVSRVFDFYSISLKRNFHLKMLYGGQPHDFENGVLHFMAPGQVLTIDYDSMQAYDFSGWMILFHPDLLWNTPLAKTIKQYEYFGYAVNEALHLSEKEEGILTGIAHGIEREYRGSIDRFSQGVIVAQLELLLTYAERYYQRQFITRKASGHAILERLETFLDGYFRSGELVVHGLPTVSLIAENLHVSPNYLSGLLRSLTGQSTQQHLHDRLIALAKEKLSTTDMTVSEIAYELGFEHLGSFSKLFKTKTRLAPLEFRRKFN